MIFLSTDIIFKLALNFEAKKEKERRKSFICYNLCLMTNTEKQSYEFKQDWKHHFKRKQETVSCRNSDWPLFMVHKQTLLSLLSNINPIPLFFQQEYEIRCTIRT